MRRMAVETRHRWRGEPPRWAACPPRCSGCRNRLPQRYSPVLRFVLSHKDTRTFTAHRWCWRGSVDGWLGMGDRSPLGALLSKYLPQLGQESFYELSGYLVQRGGR